MYLLAALGVALLALALTQIGPPASSARTSNQIVSAQNGVVQSTVTGSGNIQAGTSDDLNFQTSGTLSALDVAVGQHVNKGQLVATLDSTNAQLALDQAESQLTAAQDQLSSAESGSSTSTGSSSGGSSSSSSGSSTTSTTSSASSIATAQAAVDTAQANVNTAQTALNNTKLYAPLSGTVASVASLSTGDSVSAGSAGGTSGASTGSTSGSSSGSSTSTAGSIGSSSSGSTSTSSSTSSSPFVQIVNTSTMTMTVSFSESDVNKLKVGQAATVTPDALSGVQLGAHVTSISPVGTTSNNVVSYQATLTLDQSDPSVKPGMSATASVITGQAQGVNVPNAAVTGTGSLGTVTITRNGKQTTRQVVVGLRGNSRTQIVSGLSAGDQLVIKTVLPPLTPATTGTTSSSGTLGGTGARPGGFGGGGGLGGGGGVRPGGAAAGGAG
jgi:macrolide-specific efflux system membrane fusion protein